MGLADLKVPVLTFVEQALPRSGMKGYHSTKGDPRTGAKVIMNAIEDHAALQEATADTPWAALAVAARWP